MSGKRVIISNVIPVFYGFILLYSNYKNMPKKLPTIVVIIPTYNELENTKKMIGTVLDYVFPKIKDHEMILLYVDSHSPDGTWEYVTEQTKKYPGKLFLLDEGGKFGLGVAYTHGFHFAIERLKADGIMEFDSDFQHDPNDIPRFVAEFDKGFDYIIGSRYVAGGSIPREWGLNRKFLSVVGNLIYRVSLLMWDMHDFTTGFRLARVKGYLDNINFEKVFSKSFAYKTRLLHEIKKRGGKVIEIPITFAPRTRGDSKMNTNTFVASLKVIADIWADRLGLSK